MIRQPAVAGRFYPGEAQELERTIRDFMESSAPTIRAIGAVIPHAGYMYSGHVAGAVYSRVEIRPRCIILCPNHTGLGPPLSIMRSGSWRTPLGTMVIDEELSSALMAADPLLQNDTQAHRREHAIEVQLPFIQHVLGDNARFVPITIGTNQWSHLETLGNAIAHAIQEAAPDAWIIASSDMNHYDTDERTRVKDRKAIDRLLELDPVGLLEVVHREDISMCGVGPATSMIVAANQLGASKAELVKYATSGDVSGDRDYVVGYAGLTVL